jgi:hypothetical protein
MYFLNDFEMVPVAPIITGITFVFTCDKESKLNHIYHVSVIVIIIIIIIITIIIIVLLMYCVIVFYSTYFVLVL